MTPEGAALLRQALELTPKERTDLAAELLASIEPVEDPETLDRLWAEEMARRDQELESGEVEAIPGEVVFHQLSEKLAQVRKSKSAR